MPSDLANPGVRRLRWRYSLLVLGLVLPAMLALAWLVQWQYRTYQQMALRELAIATEQRSAAVDRLLLPLHDDLLRLRALALNSLHDESAALGPARAQGLRAPAQPTPGLFELSLDDLPALLQQTDAQLLFSSATPVSARRQARALGHAGAFAAQAQLMGRSVLPMSRAFFVSAQDDQAWLYPWQPSASLLKDAGLVSLGAWMQMQRLRVDMAGLQATRVDAFEPAWTAPWQDAAGRSFITLYAAVWHDNVLQGVTGVELALDSLQQALTGPQTQGRFWLLDEHGAMLAGSAGSGQERTQIPPAMQAAARRSELALSSAEHIWSERVLVTAPWSLQAELPMRAMQAQVLAMSVPLLLAAAVFMLMFTAMLYLLWRSFTAPALQLVEYLHRAAASPQARPPLAPRLWAPWFDLVGRTFAQWRAAAAQVQQTEALKSAIVDHALAAVVSTDGQGLIVEFNPAAELMFQRRREDVLGAPAVELITPQRHRQAHLIGIQRLRDEGGLSLLGKLVEWTAMRADGSEFAAEMVLCRTQVGEQSFYTASMVDLTERRAAEQQIQRQREALRQSEKLSTMGTLLAGVAHELNNPLAILLGRVALLEVKTAELVGAGEAQRLELLGDAQRIRTAAERCAGVVNNFLKMAKQQTGQKLPVQLNELVAGAVDLLQYSLQSGGIRLELRLAEQLPPVMADAQQIGQILLTLLLNAQQAMLTAQVSPYKLLIETGLEPARPSSPGRQCAAWLRVVDSGPGVAPALRERIFDPFFTTKEARVSMGGAQGLAHGRAIAVQHGGSLRLEEPGPAGMGASFRLSLPLAAAPADCLTSTPPPGLPVLAAAQAEKRQEGARILVVDDEAELADVIREMLESAGHEVFTAESGLVALELLAELRFDAVVSDLRMPGMDGPALWRAVRQQYPALAPHMLFVTGDTLSDGADRFLAETRCACLDKPFTKTALLSKLRPLIEAVTE